MASTAIVLVAPPASAATFGGFELAFTAPDSRQWYVTPNGTPIETNSALAPNTSPSITGLADGTFEESFVASDGTLWIDNSVTGGQQFNPCQGPFRIRDGSSPSITAIPGGGWRMAYDDGALEESGTDLPPGICSVEDTLRSNHTTPDLAAISTGGFIDVYTGTDGAAWMNTSAGEHYVGNGLGVAPGTTPVVAADNRGGWEVALQGGDNHLWTVDSTGRQVQTPWILSPTGGVGITALSTGGYEIVFQGSDGMLYGLAPNGSATRLANGLGMAPHTSPAVAADQSGHFEVAFHASGEDTVWTVDTANIGHDLHLGIWANTSPDITALATKATTTPTTTVPTTSAPATRTLTLVRQSVSEGYIPYSGVYPAIGSTQPGRLLRLRYPASGVIDTAVSLVRIGHSTLECGDPAALVRLVEGQSTTPDQITQIFGTPTPTFTTLTPIQVAACFEGPNPTPSFINLEMTVQFN